MEALNSIDYKAAALRLWMLLDDIDTLDDACRADDTAFRNRARVVQRKRFSILSGDNIDTALASAPAATVEVPTKLFGFPRDELTDIAEGLGNGYERQIDVGEECPTVESTTAYAARFIRTALAAPTEGADNDLGKRTGSTAPASSHEIPDTGESATQAESAGQRGARNVVANGGDARTETCGCARPTPAAAAGVPPGYAMRSEGASTPQNEGESYVPKS